MLHEQAMLAAAAPLGQLPPWELANLGVLAAGALVGVGWVAWLGRAGRWRNPLAGVAPPSGESPPLASLVAVPLVVYVVAVAALLGTWGGEAGDAPQGPGSAAWHRHATLDGLAKLAAAAVMLWQWRRLRGPRRVGAGRLVLVAVGGALAVTAVTTVQHALTKTVWAWLEWEEAQHPVLDALHASEWGAWGQWQLVLAAVVVAPLVEELFFRGVLLEALWRATGRAWPAVVVSGALFGVIHIGVPETVLPLCTFGWVLGYLRQRTGSVGMCVLLHALFNGRTMLMAWVAPEMM